MPASESSQSPPANTLPIAGDSTNLLRGKLRSHEYRLTEHGSAQSEFHLNRFARPRCAVLSEQKAFERCCLTVHSAESALHSYF